MEASRRSLLKFLGMAPVAAPMMAKEVAESAASDLIGLSASHYSGTMGPQLSPTSGDTPWKNKVLRFLSSGRIPEWYEEILADRHRQVQALDPDIASKRSWSLNVKISTQRLRNIDRARQAFKNQPKNSLRIRDFEEQWGLWL